MSYIDYMKKAFGNKVVIHDANEPTEVTADRIIEAITKSEDDNQDSEWVKEMMEKLQPKIKEACEWLEKKEAEAHAMSTEELCDAIVEKYMEEDNFNEDASCLIWEAIQRLSNRGMPVCPDCGDKMVKQHIQCVDSSGYMSGWACGCKHEEDDDDETT